MIERFIEGKVPAIIGVGKAVGRDVIGNPAIDSILGKKEGFTDRVMRSTGAGIDQRNWVSRNGQESEQATSDLAVEALAEAIKMAGIDKAQLRKIVVATSSPDFMAVSVASIVQHKLGLPTNLQAYDLAAGCTGWVLALNEGFVNLTSPIGREGPQAIIGAEVISPFLSKNKANTLVLFGDAAGATVIGLVTPDNGAPTNMAFVSGVDGSLADKLNVPAGGSKNPTSQYTLDNDMHTMDMDGKVIKDNAIARMTEVAKEALAESGVSIEDVALFIPHQANLSIIRETADNLGVSMEKVMVTVDKYGNTSSASIPTALREAWDTGRIKRNDIMAVVTFGAGLLYIAGILPMVGLPKK